MPITVVHNEAGDDRGQDAVDHDQNDDNTRQHGDRGPGNGRDDKAGHDANDGPSGRG